VLTYRHAEWDGMVVGAKAAAFSADDDSGLQDVTRLWLWTQYAF